MSLNKIGELAAFEYDSHKKNVESIKELDDDLTMASGPNWRESKGYAATPEQKKLNAQGFLDASKTRSDEQLARAANFSTAFQEELHDLAVIEAHLGGVAINVEQPLEIGQKIDIRTPDHQ